MAQFRSSPNPLVFPDFSNPSPYAPRFFSLSSDLGNVNFQLTVSTVTGGNWLTATPAVNTTPALIAISVNIAGLAPGTYAGSVVFSGAGHNPYTVQVQLNVGAGAGSGITVLPPLIGFVTSSGSPAQVLHLLSATPTTYLASATSSGGWLSVSPSSGTVSGIALISGFVNQRGLAAGTYMGSISITTPQGSIVIPVTLTVTGPPLAIATTSLPNGSTGVAYSQALTAAGGSPPYRWSLDGGTLPPGWQVSQEGVISGTTQVAGMFSPLIKVMDSNTLAAFRSFQIVVNGDPVISGAGVAGGIAGALYTGAAQVTGGTPPYTFSATGLPDGLFIDTLTGVISGTPVKADTSDTNVTVRDSVNRTASRRFPIVIQAVAQTAGLAFVSMTPCRIVETRPEYNFEGRTGAFGPPFVGGNETRTVPVRQSNVCSIPATARAYVLNATLIPRGSGVDFVTVYPGEEARPLFRTVSSPDGQIVANAAVVRAAADGAIKIYSSHASDVVIDIAGYFTEKTTSNLVYYPLAPCRAIDTRSEYRSPAGPYGPPTLNTRETRRFRLPGSTYCNIPSGAAAYAVTLTVSPMQSLAYLTAWPAGAGQPNVSSINSPAGRILANSVILPASADGSIDVFTFDRSDLIVDITGYFAPDDGTNGLYYFPMVQCRVSDSTDASYTGLYGPPAFSSETARPIGMVNSARCLSVPGTAKAYAVNVTAMPGGSPMPFLTAYGTGQARPNASMLNAFQGQVVTNSAIIPAGTGGSIDVFAYRSTHVAVEISGYFGR